MSSSFNHAFTPPELFELNNDLLDLLHDKSSEDSHYEQRLEKIVAQRANLVESLLNTLEEQPKRCFAAFEIKTNDAILTLVDERRLRLKGQLGTVSKSSKAIKKYHQV